MSRFSKSLDLGAELEKEAKEQAEQEAQEKEGALNPAFVQKVNAANEQAQKRAESNETVEKKKPRNYANILLLIVFFGVIIIGTFLYAQSTTDDSSGIELPGVEGLTEFGEDNTSSTGEETASEIESFLAGAIEESVAEGQTA